MENDTDRNIHTHTRILDDYWLIWIIHFLYNFQEIRPINEIHSNYENE